MAVQSLDTIKGYFRSGKYPNQSNYEDLIDTLANSGTSSSDGLKQVDLTSYSDGVEGDLVQHIGSSTGGYTYGYIYKLVSSQWTRTDVQPNSQLTAGSNISIDNGVISATDTTYTASDFDIKDLLDSTDLRSTWSGKQDTLTAGNNITIENNVISATGGSAGNKVSKFTDSIEELEVGEIGQYHGVTNEYFTEGYFYKRLNGFIDEYVDVVIPANSTKITYTNKYDNSQIIVYTVEEVQLDQPVNVQYRMYGKVYNYDNTFINKLHTETDIYWYFSLTSIIDYDDKLFYSVKSSLSNIYSKYHDNSINGVIRLYNYINSSLFESGFRVSTSTESINGRIVDQLITASFKLAFIYPNGTRSSSDKAVILSLADLASHNWDFFDYISQIYPITESTGAWFVNVNEPVTFSELKASIIDVNGTKYALDEGGGSAQSTSTLYHTVDSTGESELYIDKNHRNCVFNSKPTSTENFWARALDIKLFFDYDSSVDTTSESITIRKKVTHYDEYGIIIENDDPAFIRVNTQPLDNSDLWTSVND